MSETLRALCQKLVDAHEVVTVSGGSWRRHIEPVIYEIMAALRRVEPATHTGDRESDTYSPETPWGERFGSPYVAHTGDAEELVAEGWGHATQAKDRIYWVSRSQIYPDDVKVVVLPHAALRARPGEDVEALERMLKRLDALDGRALLDGDIEGAGAAYVVTVNTAVVVLRRFLAALESRKGGGES